MSGTWPMIARFARPTADQRTRLAVVSDLHLTPSEHGTWRVSHHTEQRLEATVDSLNDQSLDGVFFNGDLVQSGAREEFHAFDRIVERLETPLFAVPGNHDLFDAGASTKAKLTLSAFEDRYAPAPFPYRHRVGGVDLIGLNSNTSTEGSLATSFEGHVDEATLSWLDTVLKESSSPIVGVHHTLDPVRQRYRRGQQQLPIEDGGSPDFLNADSLMQVLIRNDAPLVLTGHLHVPTVARRDTVYEFSLPPLGPFPCGYTIFEIDDEGTTVTYHAIGEFERRVESLGHGLDQDRVLLAAAQLTTMPLIDERQDENNR